MKKILLYIKSVFCWLLMFTFCHTASARQPQRGPAKAICSEATRYYSEEQYALAMLNYIEGMEAAEREKDINTYLICVGCIANIYETIGDYEADIIYLFKGYEAASKTNNRSMTSIYLTNIVAAYSRMGYASLANKYYKLQQNTPLPNNITEWKYFLIYNKARIRQAEGKMKEAIKIHREAIRFAQEAGMDSIYTLYQTCEIGSIYLKQGDYQNALQFGYTCLSSAKKLKSRELQVNALDILANAYRSINTDSVNKYHALYLSMTDSVFNARNFFKVRNNMAQYETRKSNRHINKLNSIINNQLLAIIVISVLFVLSITLLVMLHNKNRNLRNAQKLIFQKHKEKTRADADSRGQHEGNHASACNNLPITDAQYQQLCSHIKTIMDDMSVISAPDFCLDKLAHIVESNRTYVSMVINNTYGKNFKSLLNERRIGEACKRLSDKEHYGHYTIQTIYEEVGYTNASSFIRAFKKVMGMPPSVYQKLEEDCGKGSRTDDDAL